MKKPITPVDEKSRLTSLRSLNILDTQAEERFDRLTRLARRMFGVPIALVSLVDENRQWFKSCIGLDVLETPRDISFCGHAILGEDIFLIPDTEKDERFADNPLVTDAPHIRFYAGCPLRHIDGNKLGTLCIIDSKPRNFTEEDLASLRDLAELAEHELAAVQLATFDDLTKIANRRGFLSLAKNSLNMCARQNSSASMAFMDLNNFKPINDKFGHAEGDRALVAFADHMRKIFRSTDVYARIGGDEFVVLLCNSDIKPAEEIIGRLRTSINDYNKKAQRGYDLSFCEGIVKVEDIQNCSIDELLKLADSVMYEKKHLHKTSRNAACS